MIIASFNVESLFERAQALDEQNWATGAPALEQHAEVNKLLGEPVYTAAIKTKIVDLLVKLGLDKSDEGRGYARLRVNRGHLLTRSAGTITTSPSRTSSDCSIACRRVCRSISELKPAACEGRVSSSTVVSKLSR